MSTRVGSVSQNNKTVRNIFPVFGDHILSSVTIEGKYTINYNPQNRVCQMRIMHVREGFESFLIGVLSLQPCYKPLPGVIRRVFL